MNFSHDIIDFAIRVALGLDVAFFLAGGAYFFVQNERLASMASQFGNITYTIHTGISWGSPQCPPEIRDDYLKLRRQVLKHGIIAMIPVLIYLLFLRPYYH